MKWKRNEKFYRSFSGSTIPNPESDPCVACGLRLGESDWHDLLDRFEATVHAELFSGYLLDADGNELVHEYGGVDMPLLRHLLAHELSLVAFVKRERAGLGRESTVEIERLLSSDLCRGLIGRNDPVGW